VSHELAPTLCEWRKACSQIPLFGAKGFARLYPIRLLPPTWGSSANESIQVPDSLAAYHLPPARSRSGVVFLPRSRGGRKTLAFFLDPDGHFIEIWQAQGK
jgi:hypothetical protein